MADVIFIIEIIGIVFLTFFVPVAIGKISDLIYENKCRKSIKNKPEEYIPGSSYEEWHNLPASEVIGDFSGMKHRTKEWGDKPLTF